MSAWFYVLAFLSIVLFASAGVMVIVAIWTVGPDSTRWALTSGVAAIAGLAVSFIAAIAGDDAI
jgi:hypothetical protein